MPMNDLLQQLVQLGPGLAAGLKGNGPGMQAFMESYQRTNAMLDAQERQKQQDAIGAQDRQRLITRQQTADQTAATQQKQTDALQRLQIPGQLAEAGGTAETPDDAKRMIETLIPGLMDAFGQDVMGMGQPAVEMATRTITARQKRQMAEYVKKILDDGIGIADNPDVDPLVANLSPHIVKLIGKSSAKLSELQQFAELPVGKPQGKTRIPPAAGSMEEFSDPNITPERKAQILADRKAYMQSDDRAPRVTVNTGANDARVNARIDRITNGFNTAPIVKEFNEVQAQHQTIAQIVNSQWSGPGDMSIIFAFMKALDPNSVVRETEYANAAKSGNIFAGWAAKFNGAVSPNGGFLSDAVKRDFLRTIETRMGVKRAQYDNLRKQTVQKIDRIRAGAPETGEEAVTDYGAAFPQNESTTPKFTVGQKVRNKKTGEMGEVTGVRPDGSPIVKPIARPQ